MATYLQGSQDYIPQIQPFVPDYNFYAGALNFKQGKYDAARKQLSTLYGSLLNAPLTRDDTSEARDKFFKTIQQDIHKMSGMDLSLAQNQEAAKGVFNQLLDNKSITRDMMWTKNFQNQIQRANGFKNCTDPDKCGGSWWEGGERLLGYQREAYKNATAQDAMNMPNAEFTPYQNVTKKAMDLAKEANFNVTKDVINGQWITTLKNGTLIQGDLSKLFMGTLGNDPKIQAYYKAQAELNRQDYIYQNKDKYGSKENAEQAYIQQMTPIVERMLTGQTVETKDEINNNNAKKEKLNKNRKNLLPHEQQSLDALYEDFTQAGEHYQQSLDVAKNAEDNMNSAQMQQKYSPETIDKLIGYIGLKNDIGNAAQIMADKNSEIKYKTNSYALEATKQKNRMQLEEFKFINKKKLEKLKVKPSDYTSELNAKGGAIHNLSNDVIQIPGSNAVGDLNPLSEDAETSTYKAFAKDRNGIQNNISGNEKNILQSLITRTEKSADGGDVMAKQDYVDMINHFITDKRGDIEEIGKSDKDDINTQISEKKLQLKVARRKLDFIKKYRNAKTLDEKYIVAKNYNIDLNEVAGSQIDDIYNENINRLMKPDEKGNKVMREYLTPLWATTLNRRRNIAAKNIALEKMDDWYAKKVKNVIADARTSKEFGPEMADAFEAYFDDKGHIVDKETFIDNMKNQGYDPEMAANLYRNDKALEPGFFDYLDSGVDAIATTVLGGITAGGFGFDYDSPTNVTNWGEPGSVNGKVGHGDAGLHDAWKRAFRQFAISNEGDQALMNIQGAGDNTAIGKHYAVVDSAREQSVATQGTISYLKDALSSPDAVFSKGYFKTEIPENDEKIRELIQTAFTDMNTKVTGKDRPIFDVTFSSIAGQDINKVGLNIKFNDSYRKSYAGTKKEEGIMADENLTTQGITIYLDKDKANNLFVEGTKRSTADKLMEWTHKIDFDTYPDYIKNFKLEKDKYTGGYKASGLIRTAIDENHKPEWTYYTMPYGNGVSVDEIVNYYDNNFLLNIADKNKNMEKTWLLEHPNYNGER